MPAELYECEFFICLFIGCAGSSLMRAGGWGLLSSCRVQVSRVVASLIVEHGV